MNKISRNSQQGNALLIIIIVGVVVILGVLGFLLVRNQASTTTDSKKDSSQTTTSSKTDTTYNGWSTATLKYEAATFKYPPTWKLTNVSTVNGLTGTVSPGSDQVKLVSPTGLTLTINTGVTGIGDGPYYGPLASIPVSTLGGNYYLGFSTDSPDGSATSGNANHASIGTLPTKSANFPVSKSIHASDSNSSAPVDVISLAYYDSENNTISKSVNAFESDASFNDAKLIIESLTYN